MKKSSRITISEAVYKASKHTNIGVVSDFKNNSTASPMSSDFKFFHRSNKHLLVRDRGHNLVIRKLKPFNLHTRTNSQTETGLKYIEKAESSSSTSTSNSPQKVVKTKSFKNFSDFSSKISRSPTMTSRNLSRCPTLVSMTPIVNKFEDQELESIISDAKLLRSQTRSLKRHFSVECLELRKDYEECEKLLKPRETLDRKYEKLMMNDMNLYF